MWCKGEFSFEKAFSSRLRTRICLMPAGIAYSCREKRGKPHQPSALFCCLILFPNKNAPRYEANSSFWLTSVKRSIAALR